MRGWPAGRFGAQPRDLSITQPIHIIFPYTTPRIVHTIGMSGALRKPIPQTLRRCGMGGGKKFATLMVIWKAGCTPTVGEK